MILRFRVECFPELIPPAFPKEDEPPARKATFCVDGDSLHVPGSDGVIFGLVRKAIVLAIQGTTPPRQRLIYPIGGLGDQVPQFEPGTAVEEPAPQEGPGSEGEGEEGP